MSRHRSDQDPQAGHDDRRGHAAGWLVAEGERATEGASLYVIETDKVETEIDAAATGVVHWKATLLETYPVGTEIGEIIVDE